MTQTNRPHQYAGFISYSQRDKKYAKKIHAALEAFRLPVELADAGQSKRKLGKFFRDDDELSGSPSLGDALEKALDGSAALIVIASPRSAQSKWVDKEIRKFKSRGQEARVFAVIVDGQPDTENESERCFPPSLLWKVDAQGELTDQADEPLAPDFRKEPFNKLITRLVAGLLGLEFDSLWKRERRRILRQRMTFTLGGAVTLSALASVAVMYQNAENERLLGESINLAAQAQESMNQGKKEAALEQVLTALPANLQSPERPIAEEALVALRRLMTGSVSLGALYKFDQAINLINPVSSSQVAVTLDDFSIHTLDLESKSIVWSSPEKETLAWIPKTDLAIDVDTDERQDAQGYFSSFHTIKVRQLTDGALKYTASFEDKDWYPSPYQVVASPSGNRVYAGRSTSSDPYKKNNLAVWQLQAGASGTEPEKRFEIQSPTEDEQTQLTAEFADDNHLILTWGKPRANIALWRVDKGTIALLTQTESSSSCINEFARLDSTKNDRITLSSDRRVLSLTRALDGEHSCIERWTTDDWKQLPPLTFKDKKIGSAELFADGSALLENTSFWKDTYFWRADQGSTELRNCNYPSLINLYPEHKKMVYAIQADQPIVACSKSNNEINVAKGKMLDQSLTLKGHQANVTALSFSNQSKRLLSGDDKGEIRQWSLEQIKSDLDLGQDIRKIMSTNGQVVVSYSPRTERPFVKLYDHTLKLLIGPLYFHEQSYYDAAAASPKPVGLTRHIQLSANGRLVALVEGPRSLMCIGEGCQGNPPDTSIRLFDTQTGQLKNTINQIASEFGYVMYEDGKKLATTSKADRSSIRIFDTEAGQLDTTLALNGLSVDELKFVQGKLIAVTSDNNNDPFERSISIIQINQETGHHDALYKIKAQAANIFVSEDETEALIAFQTLDEAIQRWAHIGPDVKVRPFDDKRLESNFADNAYIDFQGVNFIKILQKGKPVLQISKADLSITASQNALSDQQIGYDWERFETESNSPKVLGVIKSDQLSLYSLNPEYQPVCTSLQGVQADAGTLSPDGNYLAITQESHTRVYNLKTCSVAYETEFQVIANEQMRFLSPTLLLLAGRNDKVRLVDLSESAEALHTKAIALTE